MSNLIGIKRTSYNKNGKDVTITDGTLGFICPVCGRVTYVPMYVKCVTKMVNESENATFPIYRVKCHTCDNEFYTMVDYDPNIVEILYVLNTKGYSTMYSCEGHVESYDQISVPYISFKDKTICDSIKAPAGWKWDNDNPGLLSLRYVMSDETSEEILDDFYKGKSTYEDWKEQPLKDLAEWAIQIPARTDNVTELYKGLREFERNGVVDNHIY